MYVHAFILGRRDGHRSLLGRAKAGGHSRQEIQKFNFGKSTFPT